MARSADALVTPEVLVWARLSASMDVELVAQKLGVSVERLESWEDGSARPTVKQLRKAAHIYRQSFAAFFLASPPEVFRPPLRDYRRSPGDRLEEMSSDLSLDVRAAMDRRAMFLELYEAYGEVPPQFEATTSLSRSVERVGEELRTLLAVGLDRQQSWADEREAFNGWREAIEGQGLLVFQSKGIELSDVRGYSIAEFPAPVIVVNRKDAYAGRVFTMLHELTHVMLRSSGICDLDTRPDRPPEEQRVEVFCNHVAGAALVPRSDLMGEDEVRAHSGAEWEESELVALSRRYRVSREVILRRLLILGLTNSVFYETRREEFQREYESRRRDTGGFVPPSTDLVSLAGKPFVRLVLRAFHADQITTSDVSEYLGVKLRHVGKISRILGLEW